MNFQVVRVAVFAEGNEAQDALAAGADVVGADDLVDRIKDSKLQFSVIHSSHSPYVPVICLRLVLSTSKALTYVDVQARVHFQIFVFTVNVVRTLDFSL